MNPTLRNLTVFCFLVMGLPVTSFGPAFGQTSPSGGSSSGSSTSNSNAPLSAAQLSAAFQGLSAEDRAALLKQLAAVGSGPVTIQQMNSAFYKLPPQLQKQLWAKWNALSDEQRIALKNMSLASVKQIVGQMVTKMAGDKVQEAMAPVTKVVDKAKAVVDDAKTVAQKARTYVQNILGKFFGSGDSKPNP